MSKKMRKTLLLGAVAALVALVVVQVNFVNAGRPQYEVRKATMVGDPGGPPKFIDDPEGEVELHWDMSFGRVSEVASRSNLDEATSIPGYLSTKTGQPPACVCPNNTTSCYCTFSGGGGNQHLQQRR